jgi:DNA-binding MarR family transcriptional regulator
MRHASVSVVYFSAMCQSRHLSSARLPVGQLMVRLLPRFRHELFESRVGTEFEDLRWVHIQIFGNLGAQGARLTRLAERAKLSLAACAELVDELEAFGYLQRKPDPSDGRAKLICPTPRGRALIAQASRSVAAIEQRWAQLVGGEDFEHALATLHRLVRALEGEAPGP